MLHDTNRHMIRVCVAHAAFLFLKAINSANKESERQDKLDGY